jgi:glycosyltransferase involved in cell wall biosynthesis
MRLVIVPFPFMPPRSGGAWCAYYNTEYLHFHTPLRIASVSGQPLGPAEAFTFADTKWKYLSLLLAWRLFSFLKKEKIRQVLLHQPFMGPLVWMACKWAGAQFFVYAHNLEYARFRTLKKWWYKPLFYWEKWVFQKAAGVFFISEEEMRQAQEELGIAPEKCLLVPFGTPFEAAPPQNREEAKASIGLQAHETGMLFVGTFDYAPNQEAVRLLLQEVMPLLQHTHCRLFVCGKGLPAYLQQMIGKQANVRYMGFVPDLAPYFEGCSVFLNPVLLGGGVKTKVIEALSWGLPVVSSATGAQGIPLSACGGKLHVVADGHWQAFAEKAAQVALLPPSDMPSQFYEILSWKKIAQQVLQKLAAEGAV